MNNIVKLLSRATEADYAKLLEQAPAAMFNHSLRYRGFLQQICPTAEARYWLAYADDQLIAALLTFVQFGPLGKVSNSLPFYGSHGAVLARPWVTPNQQRVLLEIFKGYCVEAGVACSIIPFSRLRERRRGCDD